MVSFGTVYQDLEELHGEYEEMSTRLLELGEIYINEEDGYFYWAQTNRVVGRYYQDE